MKRLKRKQFVKESKILEKVDFEEAEVEKLEFAKKHTGSKTNKEVIKALIFQKFEENKLEEVNLAKQRIAGEKAMAYLENFT